MPSTRCLLFLLLAAAIGAPSTVAAGPQPSLSSTPTLQAAGTPTLAPTPRPKKVKKSKGKKAFKKGKVKAKKPFKKAKKDKKVKVKKAKKSKKAELPVIQGKGVVENNNSIPPLEFLTEGKLKAKAIDAGQTVAHAFFPKDVVVYPADGKLKAKSLLTADPDVKLGSIEAEVVCMANLGASNTVDGGGVPTADVWELRVLVTKAKDDNDFPLDGPPPVGVYGSLFLQDNGGVDFADENFAQTEFGNPNCGEIPFFQLEPWLEGALVIDD